MKIPLSLDMLAAIENLTKCKIRGRKRVKFNFYEYKQRPIKCSGYIHDLNVAVVNEDIFNYLIVFKHLRRGRKYIEKAPLPLKNIRFIKSSLGKYSKIIDKNIILSEFLKNHFEDRQELKKIKDLNKFQCICEG